jgi:hypothetical protein
MNSTRQFFETNPPRGDERDSMDKMHAPYAIVRLLAANDLRYWSAPVLNLLANYDGFERYVPEELDPSLCLRDLWTQYAAKRQAIPTGQIHVDICSLKILHYRAAWVHLETKEQRLWQPLTERWLDFEVHAEKNEALKVWRSDDSWPPYDQLRSHLLEAKLGMNGIER